MTRSDSETTAVLAQPPVKPIKSLAGLPAGYLDNVVGRLWSAAPLVINGPFNLDKMASGVYDCPPGGNLPSTACTRDGCPMDASGQHANIVMQPLRRSMRFGHFASQPAVDGLSPTRIIAVKAHSVVIKQQSNLATHQDDDADPGDTRSYGGVLITVPLAEGDFCFVVASSGAEPFKDQQLSELIGSGVVARLIEDGFLVPRLPASKTFILGAHRDDVRDLIAAAQQ